MLIYEGIPVDVRKYGIITVIVGIMKIRDILREVRSILKFILKTKISKAGWCAFSFNIGNAEPDTRQLTFHITKSSCSLIFDLSYFD